MPEAIAKPAAQPGNWVDPYRAYTFNLLIQNVNAGHFTEVSGLGVRIEQITYQEAGLNSTVRAVPGRVTTRARQGSAARPSSWPAAGAGPRLTASGGSPASTRPTSSRATPSSARSSTRWPPTSPRYGPSTPTSTP